MTTWVRIGAVLPFLAVAAAGCSSSSTTKAQTEDKKDTSELKWARTVAEDFLRAHRNSDGKAAYALLSPDFRSRLSEDERKRGTFDFAANRANAGEFFDAWEISRLEEAPNGLEVRFTGHVTWSNDFPNRGEPETETDVYPFTLVVSRTKDSDLWRVNLFTVAQTEGKRTRGPLKNRGGPG